MQTILHGFSGLSADGVLLLLGCSLMGILLIQMLLMFISTGRRVWYERTAQKMALEKMKLEVRTARLQCQEAERVKQLWNGCRKFQVMKKVLECEDVYSFYLAPHDKKPLPPFKPGQYLTFNLNIPGQQKTVVRCYSLSDSPTHPDYYRVTIKKVCGGDAQPPGLASCFFCDTVSVNDILDVKAPTGHFFLDMTRERPVVLISGGVGITPMISMANAIAESGSKREMWFFFGARNRSEHMLKEHLQKLADEHPNFHLHVCYSKPTPQDRLGVDYHHAERVSVDLMKKLLPSNNYDFFICGPPALMKSVTDGLTEWGVPDQNVFFEAFGPATVKRAAAPAVLAPAMGATGLAKVTFSRSGKTLEWQPGQSSVLDLAEANGIRIDAGCRAGNCGSCLVAIKSGNVEYLADPGSTPEEGSCLTCICKPKGDLVLDA